VPEQWLFSPQRLRGHRERLGLSRAQLGARVGRDQNTIKAYEYGVTPPSLTTFLLLAGSLGISPNDLCQSSPNPSDEFTAARNWRPPATRNP
jgi:transcriptional regulator with XRE-family HTH domain